VRAGVARKTLSRVAAQLQGDVIYIGDLTVYPLLFFWEPLHIAMAATGLE
jgi:hypothetical protein